jgi:hypothetical protein
VDREIEAREHLVSHDIEIYIILRDASPEAAGRFLLAKRPFGAELGLRLAAEVKRRVDAVEQSDDELPMPGHDYWGVSAAWWASTKWFAIYEFVTPDSQRILGCLAASGWGRDSAPDARSLAKRWFLQTGDRVSVLYDPDCPDRHVVYALINGLKIVQRAAKS